MNKEEKCLYDHLKSVHQSEELLASLGIQILQRDLKMIQDMKDNKIENVHHSNQNILMKKELRKIGFDDFKFLGAGGQGCVILGKHIQSQTRYAIKGIQVKDQEGNIFEKLQQECNNEIQILQAIKRSKYTPNLFFTHKGKYITYLFMNECKGTIQELLEQEGNKLNENSALKYATDVAEGILHIHSKKYLIQDIKFDNILIDYENNAVVGDVGLGNKLLDSNFGEKSFQGNLVFQPPESLELYKKRYEDKGISLEKHEHQINRQAISTKKGDAFAFGYFLYALLFGVEGLYKKMTSKQEELVFPQEAKQMRFYHQFKKIILELTKFNPEERMYLEDALFFLKGMSSTLFGSNLYKFNPQLMDGNKEFYYNYFGGQIEFIDQSENSYIIQLKQQERFYLEAEEKEKILSVQNEQLIAKGKQFEEENIKRKEKQMIEQYQQHYYQKAMNIFKSIKKDYFVNNSFK